jgi:hypothetical protein
MKADLNATEYCLRRLAPLLPALSSGLVSVVVLFEVDMKDNEDKVEEEKAEEDDDDDDDEDDDAEKDDNGDRADKFSLGWYRWCDANPPALPHTKPHVRHVYNAVGEPGVTS